MLISLGEAVVSFGKGGVSQGLATVLLATNLSS